MDTLHQMYRLYSKSSKEREKERKQMQLQIEAGVESILTELETDVQEEQVPNNFHILGGDF